MLIEIVYQGWIKVTKRHARYITLPIEAHDRHGASLTSTEISP